MPAAGMTPSPADEESAARAEEAPAGEPSPESAAEEEPKAPAQDERRWYVVHSYSGYENKVKRNLEQRIESMNMRDKIFQVVVPTVEEVELHDGKRRTVERRVFPGYVLVQMIMDDDSWYVVRNTPGVTGFVGIGNKPTPLSQEEVDRILKRIQAQAPKIRVSFRVGQKVRIIDGPFTDFVGTVDEVDESKGKVKVLVSFFGRETPIELDFLQVEKV
jgi:transcriptional antiterminator NusG